MKGIRRSITSPSATCCRLADFLSLDRFSFTMVSTRLPPSPIPSNRRHHLEPSTASSLNNHRVPVDAADGRGLAIHGDGAAFHSAGQSQLHVQFRGCTRPFQLYGCLHALPLFHHAESNSSPTRRRALDANLLAGRQPFARKRPA